MENEAISLDMKRFKTSEGAAVFQLPLRVFPEMWGYAYLVLIDDFEGAPYRVLIDVGSGFGDSVQDLEAGLRAVSEHIARPFGLENLTHILITHGHIDHIGGLTYIRPRTDAQLGVHELDLRNLTNYEERITVVARRLGEFLLEAGVPRHRHDQLLEMYKLLKSLFHSVRVDFTYEAAGMRVGPFEMLHVPGHCAGHVVIRLHDVPHPLGDVLGSPHVSVVADK